MRRASEGGVAQGPRERECLLAALLGGVQFAALPSEIGRDPEESSQKWMLHLADKAERLVDEAHQVDPQAMDGVMGKHDGQPEQILNRPVGAQERVGASDVGEVGVEATPRTALVRRYFRRIRVFGERERPTGVLPSQRVHERLGQLTTPERPEGLEHAVGGRIADVDGDQGPVHEVGEGRELRAVVVAVTTNLDDRIPFDLPGEHREAGEQVSLAGGQEPVRPVHDIPERAVALGRGPAALGQDVVGLLQRVAQPAADP